MATHRITASTLIHAPGQRLYALIADYHQGHQQILPRPPFVSVIEQGGGGTGTVILAHMRVLGQVHAFRAVVTEPEPGRELVETNDNGYVTTFTVDPRVGGRACQRHNCDRCHGAGRVVGSGARMALDQAPSPGVSA